MLHGGLEGRRQRRDDRRRGRGIKSSFFYIKIYIDASTRIRISPFHFPLPSHTHSFASPFEPRQKRKRRPEGPCHLVREPA